MYSHLLRRLDAQEGEALLEDELDGSAQLQACGDEAPAKAEAAPEEPAAETPEKPQVIEADI